jgi:hypothetical protein
MVGRPESARKPVGICPAASWLGLRAFVRRAAKPSTKVTLSAVVLTGSMYAARRIMKVEDIPETPVVITAREFAKQMMQSYEQGKIDCLESLIEVAMMAQPSPERDRFVAVMHRLLQETKADG